MQTRQRVISAIIGIVILVGLFPFNINAAADAATSFASGSCGVGVTWELDSEGLLTISGSGEMKDYRDGEAPWFIYRSMITSAVVEDTVSKIGSYAFYDCSSLTSISLPDGIKSINDRTFGNCTSLNAITLPESLESIDVYAFSGCTSLTKIVIPDNVNNIEINAFDGCSALKTVTIPEGVTYLNSKIFNGCTSLSALSLPKSIEAIYSDAINNCRTLKDIFYAGTAAEWENIYKMDNWDRYIGKDTPLQTYSLYFSDSSYYRASISSSQTSVTVGETFFTNIDIDGGTNTVFNSAQISLTYSDNLAFNSASSELSGASVKADSGTLTLVDKGESETISDGVYTLAFTANATGSASIALESAGFGTNEDAETQDLTPASCDTAPIIIVIKPQTHNVSLPEYFIGESTVTDGADYTFSVDSTAESYYSYENITATIGGEPAKITDNKNGTWTVENVTGALLITATRKEKSFAVVITGDTSSNDGTTATYNSSYSFTLPNDLTAGLEAGHSYSLASVKIGGNAYTDYTVSGRTYTINGADIKGDIEITITKTVVPANKFSINVSGSGAKDAVGTFPEIVSANGSYTLTLTPDENYQYTVTAEGYTVVKNANEYTISGITKNVTFVITKEVSVLDVEVIEYLKLNGTSMWLIKKPTSAKLESSVYTYNGESMYWSPKYSAYCVLVVSASKPVPASEEFDIVSGDVIELLYDMDVNGTGKVDANDAQLVYNMYNTRYAGFTSNLTATSFLRADANGDSKIDVADATYIVNSILGNS